MAQLGVRKRWVGWGCRGFQSARWSFVSKGNDVDRGQTLSLLCLSKVKMPLWNLIGRGKKKKKEKRTPVADSRGAFARSYRAAKKQHVSQLAGTDCSATCKVFFFFFFFLLWDKHGGARSINQVLQCQMRMPKCLNNYPVKLSSEWGNGRKVRQQVTESNMFQNIEKACEDCTATVWIQWEFQTPIMS